MATNGDVDALIRDALRAEDAEAFAKLEEPNLADGVTEIFRSKMRWYGVIFFAMIAIFSVLVVVCGLRLLAADNVMDLVRWSVGFIVCMTAVIGGKVWYWMQIEHIAVVREIKRVELLVAQLALQLRERA